jgi:alpha-galactosidase
LEGDAQRDFILHHHTGTVISAGDFEPHETVLRPRDSLRFAPSGGRPLGKVFPYFNVEWAGKGIIVVVGWPGQWSAEFARDEGTGLRIRAGQELTHFKLYPGEEVRTPLIVLQFWKGDRIKAQNIWRRWMIAHNLPRYGGKLPQPQMPAVSGNHYPGLLCNEADEIKFIDRYVENGIKLDYWWMDAGWYPNKGDWTSTGTWEVDEKRFPHGLVAVTDHAHAKGVKSIVWFEPERVTPGSWLYENHSEWLLGKDGEQKLLNLGNPEARKWLTEHIDKLLTEQGIDAYRQDFNMDPLPYWRANDTEDRQGITEIGHLTGYLAYWDELRRRRPNMLIDSCASGGHRNDLETMRRAVPLLRSDYIFDPVGEQAHTYGLGFWLPYYGTGFIDFDAYVFRSTMCPNTTLGCDVRRNDINWDLLRRLVSEWRKVAGYYLGDYYTLTSYSLENDVWMAWQFDRPDLGEGMVQAFRRSESPYEAARFRPKGLDPDARYEICDLDGRQKSTAAGSKLMEAGLAVKLERRPDSAVIVYRRVRR